MLARAAVGILALLAATACWPDGTSRKETFEVGAAPTIVLRSASGPVRVRPGIDGVVDVTAGVARAELLDALQMSSDGSTVQIDASLDAIPDGSGASFEIVAPAATRLVLDVDRGAVNVRGFTAGAEVGLGEGPVEVRGVSGDLLLEVGHGGIDVTRADGPVIATSTEGPISVSGRLRGDSAVSTQDGGIEVSIPASADLEVSATGAAVETDLPLRVQGGEIDGVLGDGSDGTLQIRSPDGPVTLVALRPPG